MPKRMSMVAALAAASLLAATPALAAPDSDAAGVSIAAPYVDGQLIVGFAPGTPAAERSVAIAAAGGASSEQLSHLAPNDRVVKLGSGRSVGQALAALRNNPNVRYADPDYIVTTQATSNDTYFTNGTLWGMYGDSSSPVNAFGSQAAEVWAQGTTGSKNTYVVVIDEGIQVTHPDLAANTWTNSFDPVDGIDNDSNGYIDDTNGWDFVSNDRTVYDSTGDDHATHVAGTIGGIGGNSVGVAGVNWNVTMISAKFLGPNGGSISNAIKAVDYATDLKTLHGLDIVATSNSWGGGGYSQGMLDAINRGGDKDILFIAAAGNSSTNNDVSASYPSNYACTTLTANGTRQPRDWDCVVAVAAIDKNGALASFSQYGASTVDLGAPGVAIQSTLPSNTYGSYSGTSMATPHVSGAAALCASAGTKRGASLTTALLSLTTPTASLSGNTVTGGRLDLSGFSTACGTPPPSSAIPTIGSFAPTSGPVGTSVTITGTDFTGVTAVRFNGVAAAFTVTSTTQIAATVPAGATSGPVTVTTSGGTASGQSFDVQTVPGAPTSLLTVSVTQVSGTVAWTAPTNLGTLVRYEIRRGTGGWVSAGTNTTYTFTGLRRNNNYSWSVRAVNTIGTGASATATLRTSR